MERYDYDLVVIGGGAAGLSAATRSAALGAKTLLVERARLGGDRTWSGGLPLKALIGSARVAQTLRGAERFGLPRVEPDIDFSRVLESVREMRRRMYEQSDGPDAVRDRGISLLFGDAAFIDPHTLGIEGDEPRRVTSRYFIVCTGSSPILPPIPGVRPTEVFTEESIFDLDALPGKLLVLGSGPIGVQFAQAFARLGSSVTVIEQAGRILGDEEPECAAVVRTALEREGLRFRLGAGIDGVIRDESGAFLQTSAGDGWVSDRFDQIIAAVGRRPSVGALALENAGVAWTEQGITINASCQTSAPHIYACGDVTGERRLANIAEEMARVAVSRLLLKLPGTYERDVSPWVVLTDPELAHLGRTSEELASARIKFETIRHSYASIDRSWLDRNAEGEILLHVAPSNGKLLGAHVVGAAAGEMINEFALAMKHGLTLEQIASTIHASPTYLAGARDAAGEWSSRGTGSKVKGVVRNLFGYRGSTRSSE